MKGFFDHGVGELADVLTVTRVIREQYTDLLHLPLLLSGFSFGGAIQLHAAQALNPKFLILVAPSVVHLEAPVPPERNHYALIIQGDQDDVVTPKSILAWAAPQSLPIVMIPGAGHFFHGKLLILKSLILRFFMPKM